MGYKGFSGIDWGSKFNDNFKAIQAISFSGAAAAGACTATGLEVGDEILAVTGLAAGTAGNQAANFESVVSVDDQIQQSSASNLGDNVYLALVLRK